MSKTPVFSDNLDFRKALALYAHFCDRINLVFGIGTRLTCNIPDVEPLNIVIKLVECNGKPVAKLSDSPAKPSVKMMNLSINCAAHLIFPTFSAPADPSFYIPAPGEQKKTVIFSVFRAVT